MNNEKTKKLLDDNKESADQLLVTLIATIQSLPATERKECFRMVTKVALMAQRMDPLLAFLVMTTVSTNCAIALNGWGVENIDSMLEKKGGTVPLEQFHSTKSAKQKV